MGQFKKMSPAIKRKPNTMKQRGITTCLIGGLTTSLATVTLPASPRGLSDEIDDRPAVSDPEFLIVASRVC